MSAQDDVTPVLKPSYVIQVCPRCGGKVDFAYGHGNARVEWHAGDCPNRDKTFAVLEVEVVPSCSFREEHKLGNDGAGSSPPSPADRPASRWVRLVGPWRRA